MQLVLSVLLLAVDSVDVSLGLDCVSSLDMESSSSVSDLVYFCDWLVDSLDSLDSLDSVGAGQ